MGNQMTKGQPITRTLIATCVAVVFLPGAVFAQNTSQPSSSAPGVTFLAKTTTTPTPPAPRVPAPMQWSGFYIGGNVGYGGGDANTTFSFDDCPGCFNPDTVNPEPMGWMFGFQGGMNYRWTAFVTGFEVDFTKSDIAGETSVSPFKFDGGTINGALHVDQSLTWVSTFRGRFGVAAGGMLYFGTAGVAVGHVNHFSSISEGPNLAPLTDEGTRFGWTIGGGVEGAITRNMSWRAQYLYINLGETSATDDVIEAKHTWISRTNTFTGGINFIF